MLDWIHNRLRVLVCRSLLNSNDFKDASNKRSLPREIRIQAGAGLPITLPDQAQLAAREFVAGSACTKPAVQLSSLPTALVPSRGAIG